MFCSSNIIVLLLAWVLYLQISKNFKFFFKYQKTWYFILKNIDFNIERYATNNQKWKQIKPKTNDRIIFKIILENQVEEQVMKSLLCGLCNQFVVNSPTFLMSYLKTIF